MALLQNEKTGELQTPEQLSHEIVNPKSEMIELDGVTYENLITITKYVHKDELAVKSDRYWEKSKDMLIENTITKLINDKADTLNKYIDKRKREKNMDYFRMLRAKGIDVAEAAKLAGVEL